MSENNINPVPIEVSQEKQVKFNCNKCGTQNTVMSSNFIYRLKGKSDWEIIDKQVRQYLAIGKPTLLSFTNKGLYLGLEVKEKVVEEKK